MEYKEIWLDVIGYEGLYQVSNLGRVKSLERFIYAGFHNILRKERILKMNISKDGYLRVSLSNNGEKTIAIHRLICLSFIPNPLNKPTVNHINGIKTDNRLCNLEWATRSENSLHAFKNGLSVGMIGEKHPKSKLTEKQVIEIRNNYHNLSHKKIGEIYGVSRRAICDIRLGRNWKHI
jgi:hypothetical protein